MSFFLPFLERQLLCIIWFINNKDQPKMFYVSHSFSWFSRRCATIYWGTRQGKKKVIFFLKVPRGCLSTLKQAHDVTVYHSVSPSTLHYPSPCQPVHSHLLVSLPFAAVRIKLYIMVAITSPASWLPLTPKSTLLLLSDVCRNCWANCLFWTCKIK